MNNKSILQNKTFKVLQKNSNKRCFRLFGKDFSIVLVDGDRDFFRKLQKFSKDFLVILLLIYFNDVFSTSVKICTRIC